MTEDESRILNYHVQRLTRIAVAEDSMGTLMALDDMIAELTGEVVFVTTKLAPCAAATKWRIGPPRSPQAKPASVDAAPAEAP